MSPFNVPKDLVNGFPSNLNESKVTEFPAGILNGANSSTIIKTPLPNTPQSSASSNSSASQSQSDSSAVAASSSSSTPSSTTTTPTPKPLPIMKH